jgi:hypothetical protein
MMPLQSMRHAAFPPALGEPVLLGRSLSTHFTLFTSVCSSYGANGPTSGWVRVQVKWSTPQAGNLPPPKPLDPSSHLPRARSDTGGSYAVFEELENDVGISVCTCFVRMRAWGQEEKEGWTALT